MEELNKIKEILKDNPKLQNKELYTLINYCINELGINLNISDSGKLFDIINHLYQK